jgi:hypothetical protein
MCAEENQMFFLRSFDASQEDWKQRKGTSLSVAQSLGWKTCASAGAAVFFEQKTSEKQLLPSLELVWVFMQVGKIAIGKPGEKRRAVLE